MSCATSNRFIFGSQTVILRFASNVTSGKMAGHKEGNHPVGVNSLPIPARILDNYGRSGVKKDAVICETCHTVHGSTDKNLLVIPDKSEENIMHCYANPAIHPIPA